MKPSLTTLLLAAGWIGLSAPAPAQEAEDFTATLNRSPPASDSPPAARVPQETGAPEAMTQDIGTQDASPPPEPPQDDFTARLNRLPGGAAPAPGPTPSDVEPIPEPPPAAPNAAPEPEADAPEADASDGDAPEADTSEADTSEADAPDEPSARPSAADAVVLDSQAGLAFRVNLPAGFDLIERPSGPAFDVYQVARDGQPFVGIYVGCCAPFPIYDGRRAEAGSRASVVVQENGRNRAVEHLFVRESDGRQVHVWLHSVQGEDRNLAEAIAQSVDPR